MKSANDELLSLFNDINTSFLLANSSTFKAANKKLKVSLDLEGQPTKPFSPTALKTSDLPLANFPR